MIARLAHPRLKEGSGFASRIDGYRLFVVLIFCVLCAKLWSAPLKAAVFVSDASGFKGAPLPSLPETGYALAIESSERGEMRVLFSDGREIERRLVTREGRIERERVYRSGVLVEERRLGLRGELLEEWFYLPSARDVQEQRAGRVAQPAFAERRVYTYAASGRLLRIESFDDGGTAQGLVEYRYDAAGRLAEMRASGRLGDDAAGFAASLAGRAGTATAWSQNAEELWLRRYDSAGRLTASELVKRGETVLRERFFFSGDFRHPAKSVSENLASGERREIEYNERGLPARERRIKDGRELERIERGFDERGRLVTESTRAAARLSVRNLVYDDARDGIREEFSENGVLRRVTLREKGGACIEELYDRGELAVRVFYEGDRKVREEFIVQSRVVRSRVYR